MGQHRTTMSERLVEKEVATMSHIPTAEEQNDQPRAPVFRPGEGTTIRPPGEDEVASPVPPPLPTKPSAPSAPIPSDPALPEVPIEIAPPGKAPTPSTPPSRDLPRK
jgi:hypothetical protein